MGEETLQHCAFFETISKLVKKRETLHLNEKLLLKLRTYTNILLPGTWPWLSCFKNGRLQINFFVVFGIIKYVQGVLE